MSTGCLCDKASHTNKAGENNWADRGETYFVAKRADPGENAGNWCILSSACMVNVYDANHQFEEILTYVISISHYF